MSFFPAICDFFGALDVFFLQRMEARNRAKRKLHLKGKEFGIEVLSTQKLNYQVTGSWYFQPYYGFTEARHPRYHRSNDTFKYRSHPILPIQGTWNKRLFTEDRLKNHKFINSPDVKKNRYTCEFIFIQKNLGNLLGNKMTTG